MKVPKARKLPSGSWFIQLRIGGESVPVTANTEKECIRQAEYIKAQHKAGKRIQEPTKGKMLPTLGEAIDAYIENRNSVLSPSTIRGYKVIRKNRFAALMDKSLSDIPDDLWQKACNAEAKICSAKTLKNAWGFIASVVADATGKQPPKVKLPQVVINERPFLEPEQIKPFIKAVHGTTSEIPALLALSSLRQSEIMALRWENIDFDKRIIKVRGAAVPDEFNKMVQKKTNKNATSTRNVPIMIDELYDALSKEKQPSGLVVDCARSTIWKRINKICETNNLPIVSIHGLRHSFVSLAYHLNVPEKIVMEIGGWSDYQTMRKIYTHIAKSDVAKYTDMFAGFFSDTPKEAQNANKNAN